MHVDPLLSNISVRNVKILRSDLQLLVTANVVPSLPILVTLMIEALRSSKTLVITRATLRNKPEVGIRHSRRRENVKSYILSRLFYYTFWGLFVL
jgi:hypothetical protein